MDKKARGTQTDRDGLNLEEAEIPFKEKKNPASSSSGLGENNSEVYGLCRTLHIDIYCIYSIYSENTLGSCRCFGVHRWQP